MPCGLLRHSRPEACSVSLPLAVARKVSLILNPALETLELLTFT